MLRWMFEVVVGLDCMWFVVFCAACIALVLLFLLDG